MQILLIYGDVWLRGLILGVLIAAPVGPIGILCIRRSMTRGLLIGLATGIGAALADAIFASVAAFGMPTIISFIKGHHAILKLLGGIILLFMAYATYKTHHSHVIPVTTTKGFIPAFMSGLFLTLTNPVTMMAILAVITGLGNVSSYSEAGVLVAGVFMGSAFWWFALSSIVSLCRRHIPQNLTLYINRGAAFLLLVFGSYAVLTSEITHFILLR